MQDPGSETWILNCYLSHLELKLKTLLNLRSPKPGHQTRHSICFRVFQATNEKLSKVRGTPKGTARPKWAPPRLGNGTGPKPCQNYVKICQMMSNMWKNIKEQKQISKGCKVWPGNTNTCQTSSLIPNMSIDILKLGSESRSRSTTWKLCIYWLFAFALLSLS